jgi:hypothetical protein
MKEYKRVVIIEQYPKDHDDGTMLLMISDGTLLLCRWYNYDSSWRMSALGKGSLFDHVDKCDPEKEEEEKLKSDDEHAYTDTAHFRDGIEWIYAAHSWNKVL